MREYDLQALEAQHDMTHRPDKARSKSAGRAAEAAAEPVEQYHGSRHRGDERSPGRQPASPHQRQQDHDQRHQQQQQQNGHQEQWQEQQQQQLGRRPEWEGLEEEGLDIAPGQGLGRRASRERSRSEEGEGLLLKSDASGHRRSPAAFHTAVSVNSCTANGLPWLTDVADHWSPPWALPCLLLVYEEWQ